MPLSLSNCGVLKVPAEMITSLSAIAVPDIKLDSWDFYSFTAAVTYQLYRSIPLEL